MSSSSFSPSILHIEEGSKEKREDKNGIEKDIHPIGDNKIDKEDEDKEFDSCDIDIFGKNELLLPPADILF